MTKDEGKHRQRLGCGWKLRRMTHSLTEFYSTGKKRKQKPVYIFNQYIKIVFINM